MVVADQCGWGGNIESDVVNTLRIEMNRVNKTIFVFLSIAVISPFGFADEIQRLQVDLNGDNKVDIISIETTQNTNEGRSRLTVRLGESIYSDDFFSADGDLPDVRIVAIDRKRSQRQLLISTPEAGSCIFHVLAFSSQKLIRLLRYDSGPSCNAPIPLGNGQLSVSTWQGFWNREDRYRLGRDGESLIAEPAATYPVLVSGAAGNSLVLQGAECGKRTVKLGTFVRVKLFDVKNKRYRIESSDGACGWIPARKLDSSGESIKELPWAG
jgi:hypothetical protein